MTDPHRPALLAAAVLLGAALQVSNGFYSPPALACLVAALVSAWTALTVPRMWGAIVPDRDDLVRALLTAAVLAQLAVILRSPIGMYFERPMPGQHAGFVPGLGVVAICAIAAFVNRPRLSRAAAGAILGVAALLGVLTYRGSPRPAIDVVTVHEEAYAALARGDSPYSMTFADPYGGKEAFYPPGMVIDGRVQYGFPYPPLSLLMAWPGHWIGDFRWAELACWLLAAAGTMMAARGSAVGVLAVCVWLFTPRAFFALEQAWTEPLALLWVGAAVWAAGCGRLALAAAFIGLAAATKQYLVLAIPLLSLIDRAHEPRRLRSAAVAIGVAALATLPGLVADPSGFFTSVIAVQVREVLRFDALSLAVTYAQATGAPMSGTVYVGIVLAATGLAAWRAPRSVGGFAAALAVTLLTTFAFGKKAFCNYYIGAVATLAMAIATSRGVGRSADADLDPLTPASDARPPA